MRTRFMTTLIMVASLLVGGLRRWPNPSRLRFRIFNPDKCCEQDSSMPLRGN